MAEIYVPGGFDFMAAGNALSQMQDARQKQQYNAMLMQNTVEDRARADQARKVAAGNALAERAALSKALEYSVVGNAGPEQPNLGRAANTLANQGRFGAASTISNYLEQIAKQEEQQAKATGQGYINEETQQKTKFATAQTDKEQAETTAKYIDIHANQINFAPSYESLIALTKASYTPGHPMAAWLAKNGVSQEDAVAELIRRRDEGIPFEETRALMARGATNAAQDAATLASTQATEKSVLATAAQTVAQTDAAAEKLAYERANPGFTIEDTAAGKVKINKLTGVVEPLTLDGQTLMPSVKPGVIVNTGEKGTENTIKKGGEITLANYQALKGAPRSIASLETVKKLILMPGTKDMLGGGASVLVDVANTLNNRLGTNINVKGLTNAVEIRSRLFEGVVARLKQMDSQPSERQQAALAEALGNIDTDPNALVRVVDVWIEEMKDKVKTHNALITKQIKSGDTAIGDYTIDLPETDAAAPNKFKWNASTGLMEQQ